MQTVMTNFDENEKLNGVINNKKDDKDVWEGD